MTVTLTNEEAVALFWMASARSSSPELPEDKRKMYASIANKVKNAEGL